MNLTTADFRRTSPSFKEHSRWKGAEASDASKRSRASRRYKVDKDKLCERCRVRKQVELHHLDNNLDNIEPENIVRVCRRCAMELDGRLDSLIKMAKLQKNIKPPSPCIICRQPRKGLRHGRCHSCNEYYRRHNKDKDSSKLDENGRFLKKKKIYKECIICQRIKHIKLKSGKCHTCYERERRKRLS